MEGSACPKCGAAAVEFEEVEGISACQACGWVLAEEQLVHNPVFDAAGVALGTFVSGRDTGEKAAASALQSRAAFRRARSSDGEAKLKARTREVGALLRLQPPVAQQALHVATQAAPHVLGYWPRDYSATAAVYAACRLNRLPLTLADAAAATQLPLHTLGRHYTALCRLLELHPPPLGPHDLLPRSADRVLADALRSGRLGAATAAALRRDAAALLDWMHAQLERRLFPMGCVGAALVLAAEMNSVTLSVDHVCASLPLSLRTLDHKLAQVRQRLVQLSALLPYRAAVTPRNAGSHARTIMQLSALVGAAAAAPRAAIAGGGDAGGGSRAGGSQPPTERQGGTAPAERGEGPGQAACPRSAGAPAGGAASPLREEGDAQPAKRARVRGPGAVRLAGSDQEAAHCCLETAQNRSPNSRDVLQEEQQLPPENPG